MVFILSVSEGFVSLDGFVFSGTVLFREVGIFL